jgi:hypothetical protein
MVVDVISSKNIKAYGYSITVDKTRDVSNTEQVSLIIRYVDCETGDIEESMLFMNKSASCTGEALRNFIVDALVENGISLDYMVAQCYDPASVMRGQYRGLQAPIDAEGQAIYVWCAAHRLNLAIEGTLQSSSIAHPSARRSTRMESTLTLWFRS